MSNLTFRANFIETLIKQGVDRKEIAQRAGVSVKSVYYYANKLGKTFERNAYAKRGDTNLAMKLLRDGLDRQAIQQQSGVSDSTIRRLAADLGVKFPRKKRTFASNYDWASMQAALDAGEFPTKVCERFGFPEGSLGAAFKRGYLKRPLAKTIRVTLANLRELLEANRDADDLAQALFEGMAK